VRQVVALGVVVATTTALGAPAALPRNDYLLVLDRRAGPYRYLDSFRDGRPGAYDAAVAAFGEPSRLRARSNICDVTWPDPGVTVALAGGLPRPCSAATLRGAAWYGMSLFGPRWHNRLGIRVGDPVTKVRGAYPKARLERPLGKPWLVLVRRKRAEFDLIVLAVAVNRAGRVASIEVPAAYVF
jgi:hypothetical protein